MLHLGQDGQLLTHAHLVPGDLDLIVLGVGFESKFLGGHRGVGVGDGATNTAAALLADDQPRPPYVRHASAAQAQDYDKSPH